MPTLTLTDIYPWVRFFLTGDATSAAPSNAQLTLITTSKVLQLLQAYPCTSDGAGGFNAGMSAADVIAFNEAAGEFVTLAYLHSPAGNSYAGAITQTRIGPDTETRAQVSLADVDTYMFAQFTRTMGRIACVRSALRGVDLFAVVGRRRVIGQPLSVNDAILDYGSVAEPQQANIPEAVARGGIGP